MSRLRPILIFLAALLLLSPAAAFAQNLGGKRLILKDGSYQVVQKYQIIGDRVRYLSTERDDWEEVPYSMVDWPATNQWNKAHALNAQGEPLSGPGAPAPPPNPGEAEAAQIDKAAAAQRLAEEEQTPTVAPGLQLPNEDGVFVLDNFQNIPEIVQLSQATGDINNGGYHNVLPVAVDSFRPSRWPIHMQGQAAKVRLHINQPTLYVSLTPPSGQQDPVDASFIVHTRDTGSSSKHEYSSPTSRYAIVRVDVVPGERVISGMELRRLNGAIVVPSDGIVPTTDQVMPGGFWMKLTPQEPLTIGEYALVEVLAPGEINLDVWDFGVNPEAPENAHPLTPIKSGN